MCRFAEGEGDAFGAASLGELTNFGYDFWLQIAHVIEISHRARPPSWLARMPDDDEGGTVLHRREISQLPLGGI